MIGVPVNSGASRAASAPLILGGAQFGMPYGVTNRRGQVLESDVRAILARARRGQLNLVDTAAAYGTSEQVLGRVLVDFPDFGIISKLPAFGGDSIDDADITNLQGSVLRSLEALRRGKLEALLIHACADLFKPGGQRLVEFLQGLRSIGVASRIGVSVYEANEIDRILKMFTPDIVQMPVNLFDQRLVRSGHIGRLRAAGVEIHGRSAFLQGVLLADAADLPEHFSRFSDSFGAYSRFLGDNKLSRLAACLGFVLRQGGVDKAVVGVTTVEELDEMMDALSSRVTLPSMVGLACGDADLIDPRRWPALAPVEMARSS
jgi:aryl-alcohol dehydrogenase-like predicted oxidoreductase